MLSTQLIFLAILVLIHTLFFQHLRISHKNQQTSEEQLIILQTTIAPNSVYEIPFQQLIQQFNRTLIFIWISNTVFSLLILFPHNDFILLTIFWSSILGSKLSFYFYHLSYIKKMQKLAQIEQWQLPEAKAQDHYWRFAFYYNPDDSQLFVRDRTGSNNSLNSGRLSGKIISGILFATLAFVMAIVLVPTYYFEYHDEAFVLTTNEQLVEIKAPYMIDSSIDYTEIQNVRLVETIPHTATKQLGFATSNFLIGKFTVNDKKAMMYVDLRDAPILYIETLTYDYYYTNEDTQKTTASFYNLQEKLN